MITLKIGAAIAASKSIFTILTTKLPVKAAYQLSKIGKVLQAELASYEEARVKLIKEIGEEVMTDAPGHTDEAPIPQVGTGQFKVADASMEQFVQQHNELLDVDINIDLMKVSAASLGDTAEISPSDLLAAEAIFED
jgi:hypothetical protein